MMETCIVSYNVHCVPVPGGCGKHHLESVAEYARMLATQHDASVFVFNELFVDRARRALLEGLRRSSPAWRASPIGNGARGSKLLVGSGVVIAWRDDRLRVDGRMHEIMYSSCCQFDCLSRKGAIHLKFLTRGGTPIHVIGTHLQAWEIPGMCAGVRRSQTDHLGNMLKNLRQSGRISPGEPVVLAGDFNENPSQALEESVGARHVKLVGEARTHDLGEFDHFYVSGSLASHSSRLRAQIATVSGSSNPSDHRPILLRV